MTGSGGRWNGISWRSGSMELRGKYFRPTLFYALIRQVVRTAIAGLPLIGLTLNPGYQI